MSGPGIGDYLISLPERVLRSTSAVAGGLLRELGDAAVPAAVRRTLLYQNLVDSTLRFLIEQVGAVEGVYSTEGKLAEDFALRRAAGNGIELLGILAFRASPVWVLAVLADLSGAGRALIREIADSLKEEGLLDQESSFETVDQLLNGLERTATRLTDTVNTPPLDVAGLRREWKAIQEDIRSIPPKDMPSFNSLWEPWRQMKREAVAQNRSLFELSSLMALSAASSLPQRWIRWTRSAGLASRRTGELFAGVVLDHYSRTLAEIHRTGYLAYWVRALGPYLRAAAAQFSPSRGSATGRFLHRTDKKAGDVS
jgi:hypothetical protein